MPTTAILPLHSRCKTKIVHLHLEMKRKSTAPTKAKTSQKTQENKRADWTFPFCVYTHLVWTMFWSYSPHMIIFWSLRAFTKHCHKTHLWGHFVHIVSQVNMTTSKLQPSILQEHAHQDELGIKVVRICPKSGQISCNYGGMSSKNGHSGIWLKRCSLRIDKNHNDQKQLLIRVPRYIYILLLDELAFGCCNIVPLI